MKNLANGRFFYEVLNPVRRYTCNDFGETPFQLLGGALIFSPPFLWGDAGLVCSGRHPAKAGPVEINDFQLSRIYSQGWNAARKLLAGGKSHLEAADAAARNPYPTGQENLRWTKGFMEALESRAGPFTTPGGSAWRPTVQRVPADGKAPRSTKGGSL
jgi:hypothetical protein